MPALTHHALFVLKFSDCIFLLAAIFAVYEISTALAYHVLSHFPFFTLIFNGVRHHSILLLIGFFLSLNM